MGIRFNENRPHFFFKKFRKIEICVSVVFSRLLTGTIILVQYLYLCLAKQHKVVPMVASLLCLDGLGSASWTQLIVEYLVQRHVLSTIRCLLRKITRHIICSFHWISFVTLFVLHLMHFSFTFRLPFSSFDLQYQWTWLLLRES